MPGGSTARTAFITATVWAIARSMLTPGWK